MEIKRNQPHVKLLIPKAVEPLQKLDYRAASTSKKLHDVSKSLQSLREGIKKQYLETQGTLIGNILDGNIEETRVQNQLIGALIKENPVYSSLGGADLSKWLDSTKINDVQARKLAILQLMKQNRTLSALLSNSVDQNKIATLIAEKEIEIIAKMEWLYKPGGSSSSSSYFPPGGPGSGPGTATGSTPGSPDFQKWANSGFVTKELEKDAEMADKSNTNEKLQQQVSQNPQEVVKVLGRVAEKRTAEETPQSNLVDLMEDIVSETIIINHGTTKMVNDILDNERDTVRITQIIVDEAVGDKEKLKKKIQEAKAAYDTGKNYQGYMTYLLIIMRSTQFDELKTRLVKNEITPEEYNEQSALLKQGFLTINQSPNKDIQDIMKLYGFKKKDDKGKGKETTKKKPEEPVATRTRSITESQSSNTDLTKSNPVKKSLKKSQGLGIKIFKNKTDMLRRLKVLIGEIEAGNNSKDVRNEIAQLADRLKAEKVIRPNVYKAIYAKYVTK